MSGDYQGRLSDITLCLTVVRARPLEVRGYMEWHAHVLPLSLSSLDHQPCRCPRQPLAPDIGRASYRPRQPTTAPLPAPAPTMMLLARPTARPGARPTTGSCPCPQPDIAALVRAPSTPSSTAHQLRMLPLSKLYVCVD